MNSINKQCQNTLHYVFPIIFSLYPYICTAILFTDERSSGFFFSFIHFHTTFSCWTLKIHTKIWIFKFLISLGTITKTSSIKKIRSLRKCVLSKVAGLYRRKSQWSYIAGSISRTEASVSESQSRFEKPSQLHR